MAVEKIIKCDRCNEILEPMQHFSFNAVLPYLGVGAPHVAPSNVNVDLCVGCVGPWLEWLIEDVAGEYKNFVDEEQNDKITL